MTIMPAPQREHARGSTPGVSAAASGRFWGSGRRGHIEECAGGRDGLGAVVGGKEPVVADYLRRVT